MVDIGHSQTDEVLESLEKRLAKEYAQAYKEVEKKAADYFARFAEKDKAKKALVDAGKLTEKEYQTWRRNQMLTGKRWNDLRDTLAADLTNVNKIATSIVNGELNEVFAINANYSEYLIENGMRTNYGFTLYDRDTVANLVKNDPDIIPWKPAIDVAADKRWNRQMITSHITQGILQGESIPNLSKRLAKTVNNDKVAAVRTARTAVTSSQNAGRQMVYDRAKDMGLKLQKEWMATLDGRTRHDHGRADGQRVPLDGEFVVGGKKMKYPGDMSAPAHLVYNCRCTTITVEPDYITKGEEPRKTYDEWMAEKQGQQQQQQTIQTVIDQEKVRSRRQEYFEKKKQPEPVRKEINGKDLVGEIDYANSKFDYDIETALNAQGFDGLPKVVSNEEFEEALKKSNFYAERTYSAPTQEVLDEYRNQLYNGKWYVDCSEGGAQYGQGMYCAARFEKGQYIIPQDNKIGWEMAHYQSIGASKGNKFSYTEGITLTPDAKIFTLYEDDTDIINRYAREYALKNAKSDEMKSVIREMIDIQEKIDRSSNSNFVGKVDWDFVDKLYDERAKIYDTNQYKDEINKLINEGFSKAKANPGALAAEMGYDAINAQGHGESGSYTVILNRTKCIFREGGSRYGNN